MRANGKRGTGDRGCTKARMRERMIRILDKIVVKQDPRFVGK
jgi:hypothetical protein